MNLNYSNKSKILDDIGLLRKISFEIAYSINIKKSLLNVKYTWFTNPCSNLRGIFDVIRQKTVLYIREIQDSNKV
jgi:hypothetical protein